MPPTSWGDQAREWPRAPMLFQPLLHLPGSQICFGSHPVVPRETGDAGDQTQAHTLPTVLSLWRRTLMTGKEVRNHGSVGGGLPCSWAGLISRTPYGSRESWKAWLRADPGVSHKQHQVCPPPKNEYIIKDYERWMQGKKWIIWFKAPDFSMAGQQWTQAQCPQCQALPSGCPCAWKNHAVAEQVST